MIVSSEKKTILLVEDEEILAMTNKMSLEKYGYKVINANSGEEAIEIFHNNHAINLILMDIDLGSGIDGTEAATTILKDREIPVVFLSSHIEPEIVEKTEKITSYGYVVKNSGITILDASIKMAFKLFDANKKIAENEAKYRSIFEDTSLGIFHSTFTGRFLEMNPALAKMLGYSSPQEAIDSIYSISDQVYVTPSKREEVISELMHTHGKTIISENRFRKKDGKEWNAYLHLRLIMDSQEKPLYLEGIVEDVTERKHAEDTIRHNNEELAAAYEEMQAANEELEATTQALIATNTDLETKEAELRKSEESLSITLQSIGDAVIATDINGNVTLMNKTAEKLTGWNFIEAQNKPLINIFNIVNDITQKPVSNPVEKALETGEVIGLANHTVLISRDGTQYQISDSAAPIKDSQGITRGVILVFSDITEEYKAEKAISESETKFRNIINISPIPMALNDDTLQIIFLNPAFIQTFGYTHDEIPTLADWWPRAYPDPDYRQWVANSWQAELDRAKRTNTPFSPMEATVRCKDGTDKIVLANAASFTNSFENTHLVVLYDITERKQAENTIKQNNVELSAAYEEMQAVNEELEATTQALIATNTDLETKEAELRKSEESLSITLQSIGDAVIATDIDGNVTLMNKTAEKLTGWNFIEAQNKPLISIFNIVNDRTRKPVSNPVEKALETGEVIGLANHTVLISRDGTEYQISDSAAPINDSQGITRGVILVFSDITEKYKAEKAISEREVNLRRAQNVAKLGSWDWDPKTDKVTYSDEIFNIYGIDKEHFGGSFASMIDSVIHPEDRERLKRTSEKAKQSGGGQSVVEFRINHPKGIRWIRSIGESIYEGGKFVRMIGVNQDITEQKEAEKALRESEANLKKAQRIAKIGSWEWDSLSDKVNYSDEIFHVFGIDRKDFKGSFSSLVKSVIHPDDLESFQHRENSLNEIYVACLKNQDDSKQIQQIIDKAKQTGGHTLEYRIFHSDGSIHWIKGLNEFLFNNSKLIKMLGVVQDITEQKQAEEALRENEKKFKNLFNNSEVGMFRTRLDGSEALDFNDKYLTILGKTREESLGKPSNLLWADPKEREAMVEVLKAKGHVEDLECRLIRNDSKIIHCITSLRLYPEQGILEGSIMDITDRKQAEQALKESETKYRELVENSPDAIAIHVSGKIVFANKECGRLMSASSPELLVGKSVIEFVHPDSRELVIERMKKVSLDGAILPLTEEKFVRLDGSIVDVEVKGIPIEFEGQAAVQLIVREITERKQAEAALRESEEKFRVLFESATDGIFLLSSEGKVKSLNEAFAKMHGYPDVNELLNVDLRNLDVPETAKLAPSRMRRLLDGEPLLFEAEHYCKNGQIIPLEVSTNLVMIGNEKYVIGFHRDITHRRQTEKIIQDSEKRLKYAQEIVGLGFWDLNVVTGDLYWSDQTFIHYGFKPQTFIPTFEKFSQIVHQDDLAYTNERVNNALQNDAEYSVEFRFIRADGEIRYLFTRGDVTRDANGKAIRFFGSQIDITERKRIEIDLLKKTEELDAYFSDALDLFCIANTDGYFLKLNKSWENTLGYSIEELEGIKFLDLVHPDDVQKTIDSVSQLSNQKNVLNFINRYKTKDGSYRILEWKSRPSGNTIFAAARDITERKQAETALRKSEENVQRLNAELEQRVIERTMQLEAANKELEAFSYTVSHDLRAPLRHIDGYVDLLVSRCRNELNDKGRHYVDIIAGSARQMGRLIDELLQFSRTGRAEMHLGMLEMSLVFQEALSLVKDNYSELPIEWVIGEIPNVRGDYTLIRQVWMNLLDNAVKYSRKKDIIKIEVNAIEEENEIIFSIKDNGVGFDMQYANKLFGVFQRLHPAEEFEGNGIGLASIKRIINRHGGRIWAEAELNNGATFKFTLPKLKE